MTRPTTLPRWAETAGGAPAANIVTPSSGQMDTGWTPSQIPPSSYFNDWMRLAYLWIKWLDMPHGVYAPGSGYAEVAGWVHTTDGFIQSSTPGATWLIPLNLRVGDVVTSSRFKVAPNGATSTITCSIVRYLDETTTVIASATSGAGTGSPEWLTVASSFTVAASEFYVAKYTMADVGTNLRRGGPVEINP